MKLYLNSGTDYTITNGRGQVIPLANARELWESHKVEDHNIAFQRLVEHDFDLQATKAYYEEEHKKWVERGGTY